MLNTPPGADFSGGHELSRAQSRATNVEAHTSRMLGPIMKRLIHLLFAAAAFLIILSVWGVNYAIQYVLPYSPIRPHRCTVQEMARYSPELLTPEALGVKWDDLDITLEDSIRLKGWFVHARGDGARETLILLHGIGSCRISMLARAQKVDSVRPEIDARRISQPAMITHGSMDEKISPAYGKRIFDNLAPAHREWYLVEGAGHDDVSSEGGAEYENRVTDFFRKHMIRTGLPD
jgi:hypothetical protein